MMGWMMLVTLGVLARRKSNGCIDESFLCWFVSSAGDGGR